MIVEYCGVFAITEDKTILMAIKTEDGIDCFEGTYSNPKYIGKLVKDIELLVLDYCFLMAMILIELWKIDGEYTDR